MGTANSGQFAVRIAQECVVGIQGGIIIRDFLIDRLVSDRDHGRLIAGVGTIDQSIVIVIVICIRIYSVFVKITSPDADNSRKGQLQMKSNEIIIYIINDVVMEEEVADEKQYYRYSLSILRSSGSF